MVSILFVVIGFLALMVAPASLLALIFLTYLSPQYLHFLLRYLPDDTPTVSVPVLFGKPFGLSNIASLSIHL